jgi:3-isopropylmalate/(R)-2-methylmalate dehydratase small subunit
MEKFVRLTGIAAPLLKANIDTDTIAPGARPATSGQPRQFSEKGTELKRNLFAGLRYDKEDRELPGFVLNQEPYRRARFLIAGPNFACGSSRETACWMLSDFGIRCIMAPSFGEIFYDSCFKNGMLPIILPGATLDALAQQTLHGEFTVDLETKSIVPPSGQPVAFDLPEFLRRRLLLGLDEIETTRLAFADRIDLFQNKDRLDRPWVYPS